MSRVRLEREQEINGNLRIQVAVELEDGYPSTTALQERAQDLLREQWEEASAAPEQQNTHPEGTP